MTAAVSDPCSTCSPILAQTAAHNAHGALVTGPRVGGAATAELEKSRKLQRPPATLLAASNLPRISLACTTASQCLTTTNWTPSRPTHRLNRPPQTIPARLNKRLPLGGGGGQKRERRHGIAQRCRGKLI